MHGRQRYFFAAAYTAHMSLFCSVMALTELCGLKHMGKAAPPSVQPYTSVDADMHGAPMPPSVIPGLTWTQSLKYQAHEQLQLLLRLRLQQHVLRRCTVDCLARRDWSSGSMGLERTSRKGLVRHRSNDQSDEMTM